MRVVVLSPGVVEPPLAYVNLGTAVVSVADAPEYQYDLAFLARTAIAESGKIFDRLVCPRNDRCF